MMETKRETDARLRAIVRAVSQKYSGMPTTTNGRVFNPCTNPRRPATRLTPKETPAQTEAPISTETPEELIITVASTD